MRRRKVTFNHVRNIMAEENHKNITVSTGKPFRGEIETITGEMSYIHGKTKAYILSQAIRYHSPNTRVYELKNGEYVLISIYAYSPETIGMAISKACS